MRVSPPLLRPGLRHNAERDPAAGFFLTPSTSCTSEVDQHAGGGRLGARIEDAERVNMLTTRTLSLLRSRHLGVEVAPYAARLVRDGVLARCGEPIDEREAAILLLAVAAAPDPNLAIDALRALASATPMRAR